MPRSFPTLRALLLLGPAALLGACAAMAGAGPAPPLIESVEPASGPAGEAYPLEITLRGGPFPATGAVVRFGPVRVGEVPSADGRSLSFAVPKAAPSAGEVPPRVLPPGRYEITVEVDGVRSAPALFVLTEAGA